MLNGTIRPNHGQSLQLAYSNLPNLKKIQGRLPDFKESPTEEVKGDASGKEGKGRKNKMGGSGKEGRGMNLSYSPEFEPYTRSQNNKFRKSVNA